MDSQQIGLKLAFDGLELPFTLASFDDRLILQKTVYLLQSQGLELGYHFHWYRRGPYSPSLTRDSFAIKGELSTGDDSAEWKLDEASQQRLSNLKPLFQSPERSALAARLELLGSVLYLLQSDRISANAPEAARSILLDFGKDFSTDEINTGITELNQYGFWGNTA